MSVKVSQIMSLDKLIPEELLPAPVQGEPGSQVPPWACCGVIRASVSSSHMTTGPQQGSGQKAAYIGYVGLWLLPHPPTPPAPTKSSSLGPNTRSLMEKCSY